MNDVQITKRIALERDKDTNRDGKGDTLYTGEGKGQPKSTRVVELYATFNVKNVRIQTLNKMTNIES